MKYLLILVIVLILKNAESKILSVPYEKDGYIYFTGIKTNAESIEQGRRDAENDAIVQIIRHIGITATYKYIQIVDNFVNEIREEMQIISSSNICDISIDQIFYKTKKAYDPVITYYDIYDVTVIIKISKKRLSQMKQKISYVFKNDVLSFNIKQVTTNNKCENVDEVLFIASLNKEEKRHTVVPNIWSLRAKAFCWSLIPTGGQAFNGQRVESALILIVMSIEAIWFLDNHVNLTYHTEHITEEEIKKYEANKKGWGCAFVATYLASMIWAIIDADKHVTFEADRQYFKMKYKIE